MEQNKIKQEKAKELTEKPKEVEIQKKVTESNISTKKQTHEKEEQLRTTRKKELFLEHFEKTMGAIKQTCEKIDIARKTFYEWKNGDPDFAKALETTKIQTLDDAEGILMALVRKGVPRAVTYFLDRQHPGYKPRTVTEIVGAGTAQESINKITENLALKLLKDGKSNNNTTDGSGDKASVGNDNQRPADRGNDSTERQEGKDGAVHSEPGTEILLEKKDKEKPHTESPTKGNK
jgi:ACT domain-containing protein